MRSRVLVQRILKFALALALLIILSWMVQVLPEWQVRRADVRSAVNPKAQTTPEQVAALENEMRKTLIQMVGGGFALLALYFTFRRLQVADQVHITDRYSKAIEQLGALTGQGEANVEVRLGAIYALERIALDSPRDHWPIMEVLTAYVRQNAPATEEVSSKGGRTMVIASGSKTEIQAILTVLGRRRRDSRREREGRRLDLSRSDLRQAVFREANMDGVDFADAHVEEASFLEAHLKGTLFRGALAEGAVFTRAQAESADFSGAHIEEVDFTLADLRGARFRNAHTERSDFTDANMESADFRDAYVDGADFRGAKGLSLDQVRSALDWQKARFDVEFSEGLGLLPGQDANESDGTPPV